MFEPTRSKWLRYGFAVVSVVAALLLTLLFQVLIDPDPLSLYFMAAVVLSVWFGGIGPGLVATAMSIPVIDYFVLRPTYAFSALYPANFVWLVTFFGVALLTNSILESRNKTAKRHAEQSDLLRVTLTSIGDGVIATDNAAKVTFINPTAEMLTGWKASEAQGRDIHHVLHIVNEETQGEIENPVTRVLREGRIARLASHSILVAKDGTKYRIDDSGAPIRNTVGEIVGAVVVFRDVSAQKEAETALSESETRFQIMADSAPVLMWVSDTAKNCVFCNKGWLDYTGRTLEEELQVGWVEDVHPDDYPANWEIFAKAFDARQDYVLEYRLRRRDGVYHWVIEKGVPRFTSDGTFAGYIGSCIDIHDLKETETERANLAKSLETERERLKSLVANVPGVVWESWGEPDADNQRIDFVSNYVETMLGYSVEEWVNTPNFWLTIVHPDDREQAAAAARAGYQSAQPHINRFRWLTKDGRAISIETQSTAIQDSEGNPIGMRGISVDVSERERLEAERTQALEALRQSETRLRTMLENMPIMLVAADENTHIVTWNREAERITGYSSAEVIGNESILNLLFPDEAYQRTIRKQWERHVGELRHSEVKISAKDGSIRYLDWSDISLSFPIPGWSSWLVGVDITERKRSEERITLLQALTADLSEALTPHQVAEVIVGNALTALGGHLGAVWLLSEDGASIEVLNQKGFRDEVIRGYTVVPSTTPGPLNDAIRAGEPIWIESQAEYAERYPNLADLLRKNGTESSANVPLMVNGSPIGAITLSFQRANALGEEDRAFITALGEQCAQALERARLYDAERLAREDSEAAQQRLAFVAEASTALTSSLDYGTTLKNLANLAVPTLCDMCGIYMADEQGELNILTITHADPDKVALGYELYRHYKPDPNAPGTTYNVFRTGKPQILSHVTDEMLVAAAQNERHLEIMREIGITSLMNVPLISRDQVLGVVVFVSSESGRHYGTLDLALATEVARRGALAVDNARLYAEAREQRERLRVILASIGDAVIATDTDGRISFMNDVAQSLTGWSQDAAQGQPLDTVFHIVNETTRETVESPYTRVMREGAVVGLANHTLLIHRDGLHTPIDDSGAPIRDEQGNVTGVVLVFRNITERKRLEERLRFLVDAGALLTSSLDYETTLETLVRLAIPRFADWCIVRMPDANGKFRMVAKGHVNPAKVDLMLALEERYPPEDGPAFGYVAALGTGKGVLRADVTPAVLDSIAQSPEHREMLGQFDWRSHMSVPAKVGDEIVALITFATSGDSGRTYDERDLGLAEELARRMGIAIQNARLYETERQARALAERASARIALLQQITSAFSEAVTPFQVADVVVTLAFPSLGIDAGGIFLVSEDGAWLEALRVYGYGEATAQLMQSRPITAAQSPLLDVIHSGKPIWLDDFAAYQASYPDLAERSRTTTGTQAAFFLPLNVEQRTIGVVGVAFLEPRTTREEDRAFWMALAHQCAQAMERARLFAAEQSAREQAINILESISDAFYTLDWDWRFTYVNGKAEELWGREREHLIGKVLWEEFPEVVGSESYQQHFRAKEERRPLQFETISPVLHHWIEANMYPSESGLSVYFRDIRERKQAEQERTRLFEIEQRARREAEAANELKLKFLAMISHELRTPLTSIKGFATTLLAEDVSFDAGFQRQFIGIIDEEADKLTELIEQLLDLSRLQAGNLRIRPTRNLLADIIDDARAQLETLSANHTLISRVPDDLPHVMADPLRVGQVLVNLVGNSTKFAPKQTPIIIRADQTGDMVKISVSDAGPGIPAEAQTYVFEAFRQVEIKPSAQKGAGLGLAICKGLIEAQGGTIWIDNSAASGTTISFTLPIAQTEAEVEEG